MIECPDCARQFADAASRAQHIGSGGQCCHPPSRNMYGIVRHHTVIWTLDRPLGAVQTSTGHSATAATPAVRTRRRRRAELRQGASAHRRR